MAEGMVGSLGRAPEECQAQGECQALGRSCVQMGPGSAREGRRWAVPDGWGIQQGQLGASAESLNNP